MTPLELLRHHVTGAIERGEAVPVTEQGYCGCKQPQDDDRGFCMQCDRWIDYRGDE